MELSAQQSSNTVRNVVIGVFALLFVAHLPALYDYTRLRLDIEQRYRSAAWAKAAVETAATAHDLSSLPAETWSGTDRISISTETGVVTITFGGLPAGSGDSLKMLPIVDSRGQRYPLFMFVRAGGDFKDATIYWACTSSLLRSLEDYLRQNIGSLPGELAPPECRYITWLGLKPAKP